MDGVGNDGNLKASFHHLNAFGFPRLAYGSDSFPSVFLLPKATIVDLGNVFFWEAERRLAQKNTFWGSFSLI